MENLEIKEKQIIKKEVIDLPEWLKRIEKLEFTCDQYDINRREC
jgi:hypothetical protein